MWKAKGVDVGEVKIRKNVRFRLARIEKIVLSPKLWLQPAMPDGFGLHPGLHPKRIRSEAG